MGNHRHTESVCAGTSSTVNVDLEMVCQRGGFIIQHHTEPRNLEAEMLSMVCNDVEIEPVL